MRAADFFSSVPWVKFLTSGASQVHTKVLIDRETL
jgi:hypothetical protein